MAFLKRIFLLSIAFSNFSLTVKYMRWAVLINISVNTIFDQPLPQFRHVAHSQILRILWTSLLRKLPMLRKSFWTKMPHYERRKIRGQHLFCHVFHNQEDYHQPQEYFDLRESRHISVRRNYSSWLTLWTSAGVIQWRFNRGRKAHLRERINVDKGVNQKPTMKCSRSRMLSLIQVIFWK